MEEILKLINKSYSYDHKFADLIIKFIKKYEEIKINPSLIEIVNLIEKILTKKQVNDLKSLESILNSLKNEEKKKISYKEIIDTLDKIRKNGKGINNNKNQEEQNEFFLKLIIPIKILDDMKLEKDIKEKIELIDIPGLNTEQKYLENKHFKTLIKYSNGFLFVTKKNATKEKSNKNIIYEAIYKIRHRKKIDFSFNSLFFILTDEKSYKNDKNEMEEKKKDIKNSINSNDMIINQNIKDDDEFLISRFSNTQYKKYLEDFNTIEDINKFYDYLKQKNKNINIFFGKLENKKYYDNYKPSEDDLKKYKSLLTKNSEDKFISQYLFLRENISNHEALKKSNYLEFKENFSKLITCSKKSLDESVKNGIINFIEYLRSKLYKIIFQNKLKEIDINEINDKLNNLEATIKEKVKKFKEEDFEKEIDKLVEDVRGRRIREERIVNFSTDWKTKKNNLDEEIKNLIVKEYSEIEKLFLKDSEYEKKKFFTKKHIIVHGTTAAAQVLGEGAFFIFSTISISFPPIAIAIGAFSLIHGGICLFKFIRDKIKEPDDLIEHISKYKKTFIDNLDSYETDINTFLKMRKDIEIREIIDKNIAGSLKLNDEETTKFKEIYSSFEKKLNSYFNFE